MYQSKAKHALSRGKEPLPQDVIDTLWSLFCEIGVHWTLKDNAEDYRLRFLTFIDNRIELDPLYEGYYRDGAALIQQLAAKVGDAAAFNRIFANKPRIAPSGVPATILEVLQRFVANEFIALRLALGGFKSFGAVNYCGYFGGANIEGEPTPYRERS
ncbi:hypothetical protein GOD53_31030 [Sinorhizobium medicae]|nr:hypothetical protein [Sinorhizobium medicae]MDX0748095.1 hypothetical protein [Sinorhizobium medicae]